MLKDGTAITYRLRHFIRAVFIGCALFSGSVVLSVAADKAPKAHPKAPLKAPMEALQKAPPAGAGPSIPSDNFFVSPFGLTPPTADLAPGIKVPSLGNNHIPSVDTPHVPYNSKPPTSGPHLSGIAKWGLYDQPIPNELQVHNLEDGGVLIQYDCTNCQDLIAKLEKIGNEYLKRGKNAKKGNREERYKHIIVAPYPGMNTLIALTAWGVIEKISFFEEAKIKQFVEAYIGIDHHKK